MILHAIIASSTESLIPSITTAKTSMEAIAKITSLFASKTRSRIMSLKKKLSQLQQGSKTVVEYIQQMKNTVDELAMAQAPVDENDLIIFILNGLSTEYREISTAIRARESAISLEVLHDKLTDFEQVIHQDDAIIACTVTANIEKKGRNNFQRGGNSSRSNYSNPDGNRGNYQSDENRGNYLTGRRSQNQNSSGNYNNNKPTCQLCNKYGHSAGTCRNFKISSTQEHVVNHVSTGNPTRNFNWSKLSLG